MPRLNLQNGVPETLAIARPGESVPSNFTKGGYDVLFKTIAGDSLYIDPERAGDIERGMQALGIQYGQLMQLTKTKTAHGGHAFSVSRLPGDNGGHHVPERGNAYRDSAPPAAAVTPQTTKLCASMCSLIDAMAEAKTYASRRGLDLSTEDLRALAVTAYIQDCRGGR